MSLLSPIETLAVKRNEKSIATKNGFVHCCIWKDDSKSPETIVMLFHGLMLHSSVFDKLARHLAGGNVVVLAPDLRGFGRSYFHSDSRRSIDYAGSFDDAVELLHWLRSKYSTQPIIVCGESLGAHLARDLAANCSAHVNGLVLSNPCIRPRMVAFDLVPHMVSQAVQIGFNGRLEANLIPFVSKFLSDEPDNLQQYLDDPMCRKSLDLLELIDSMLLLGSFQPKSVPATMPLLVYRGSNDGVCQNASYKQFMSSLKTDDMAVVECHSCAHLILQSKTITSEVVSALDHWLDSHRVKWQHRPEG